jgi:Trk K+ transport system NAD-binding subunit
VVGLGNVGTRVIRQLHDLDLEVVAIDKAENPRGAAVAEELKIPLIVGDASQEGTLREAFVKDCRALLVLSTDDVTNLQTALLGRALKPDLRVVLRLFEGDLAERIQQKPYDIAVSRSVSYLAAPEFAAAMMEREVIKTIPVGRHVLLVAEVPVAEGSPLDGATVAAARGTDVRVIALAQWGEPGAIWNPVPGQRIAAGDRLAVVARRAGLGTLLVKANAPVLLDQPG